MVEDFGFSLDEEMATGTGKMGRDPARAKMRDAVFLGDADAGVQEFARLMGWEEDLERVRIDGEGRFEEFKRDKGDGGWWSVFAYPDNRSPLDDLLLSGDEAPETHPRTRPRAMSGASEMWLRMQARFGVETPRNCEFM
jgi:hypothetical protein